jgi:hypothetical protein
LAFITVIIQLDTFVSTTTFTGTSAIEIRMAGFSDAISAANVDVIQILKFTTVLRDPASRIVKTLWTTYRKM